MCIDKNIQQQSSTGHGRSEENVVGDYFSATDKVMAPRVRMCRIDYQTRTAPAEQTRVLQTTQIETDRRNTA